MRISNLSKVYVKILFFSIVFSFSCNLDNRQNQTVPDKQTRAPTNGLYFGNSDTSSFIAVIQSEKTLRLYKIRLGDSLDISVFFGERNNDSIYMDWRDYQRQPYNPKIVFIGGPSFEMWSVDRKKRENPDIAIKSYASMDKLLKGPNLGQGLQQITNDFFSSILADKLKKKIFNFERDRMLFDSGHLNNRKYNCNITISHNELDYLFNNPYGTINLFYNLIISGDGVIINSSFDNSKNIDKKVDLLKEVKAKLIGRKAQIYSILGFPVITCIPCAVTIRFN